LTDRDHYPYFNRVLLITASLATQIKRVMLLRDQCSATHANAILMSQPELKERFKLADDVVINDGDIADLKDEIDSLHEKYLNEASSSLPRFDKNHRRDTPVDNEINAGRIPDESPV